MAIVLIDGFDQYPTAGNEDIGFATVEHYETGQAATYDRPFQIVPSDRFGNQGKMLQIAYGDNLRISNTNWWSTYNTLHIGFAVKFENTVSSMEFLNLYGEENTSRSQISLCRDGVTGELVLGYASEISNTLERSDNQLQVDTWYWFEMKAVIHDSAGYVTVKIDGSSDGWINFGPGDTQYYTNASYLPLSSITFRGDSNQYNNASVFFDDLVIQDDDPTNNFIGDSRVTTLFPRSDDTVTGVDFATYPSTGDDNAQFLNDEGLEGPSEDDYYVYTSTSGDEDIYDFDTIDDADTIHAVSIHFRARKTSNATRTAQSTVFGGTNQTGEARELALNYVTYHDVFRYYNDSTQDDWTQTNLGTSKFGLKVVT